MNWRNAEHWIKGTSFSSTGCFHALVASGLLCWCAVGDCVWLSRETVQPRTTFQVSAPRRRAGCVQQSIVISLSGHGARRASLCARGVHAPRLARCTRHGYLIPAPARRPASSDSRNSSHSAAPVNVKRRACDLPHMRGVWLIVLWKVVWGNANTFSWQDVCFWNMTLISSYHVHGIVITDQSKVIFAKSYLFWRKHSNLYTMQMRVRLYVWSMFRRFVWCWSILKSNSQYSGEILKKKVQSRR